MTDLSKFQTDIEPTVPTDEAEPAGSKEPTVDIEYPHSEWYDDPNGDLEIVSSDGILIKLAAYRLQASSPVFAELITRGKDGRFDRIFLHDQELETISVLHGLFDTMIKHTNILDLSLKPTHSSTRRQLVIRLAQKYQCKGELQMIKLKLELGLYVRNRNPWHLFELAVRLGDVQLCTDAIKKASNWSRDDKNAVNGSENQFGDALLGEGLFDIRSYSLEAMKALPIEVIWALARASHSYVSHNPKQKTLAHEELAVRFRKLMELNDAPKIV